jgi:hypothetical protein
LNKYITEVEEFHLLKTTDTCLINDNLFSKFLRFSFPLYMFVGEFSDYSNDITVDLVFDEAVPTLTIKLLSDTLDHGVVRATRQSYAVIKPLIYIRFRVNLSSKRPLELKIILRLKDLKLSKGAKKKRNKASRDK